ncbi:MAG TPA: aspartyl/asparaginyl beta-hydroxylase domain-containing protein, partial [Ignavibacteriaceae bacterium]
GSIKDYETNQDRFKETDFVIFNEEFKNTSLYEIYNTISGIGRFRIMNMNGPSCYTIHRDKTKRYHYVIETNSNCMFLFPGLKQQFYIPKDENLYLVDTRYRHTFVNGSRERRIHLVMDDISSLLEKSR